MNGVVVRALGTKADPRRDAIAVDGEPIGRPSRRRLLLVHKPRGVVSTLRDPEGRETIPGLLRGVRERVFPVGRLDLQTSGLLLVTNDGELAARLAHPRAGLPRVYRVKVDGQVQADELARLRRGVRLADGIARPERVRIVRALATKTWLEVTLREGRRRLVRRLFEAVGHPVDKLSRVAFGPLRLGSLPPGGWRDLDPREVAQLEVAAGIRAAPSGGEGTGAAAAPTRGTRPSTRRPRPADRRPREGREPPGRPLPTPPTRSGPTPRLRGP